MGVFVGVLDEMGGETSDGDGMDCETVGVFVGVLDSGSGDDEIGDETSGGEGMGCTDCKGTKRVIGVLVGVLDVLRPLSPCGLP